MSAVLEALPTREHHQTHPTASRLIHKEIQYISFSGASGVGKNYLVNKLLDWAASSSFAFGELETNTTRLLRQNQDREYRHMSREEFERRRQNNEFAWVKEYKDNLYGTLQSDLERSKSTPYPWLIHVTHDTVCNLRAFAPGRVFSIFCFASMETLRHNLKHRPDSPIISREELNRLIEDRLATAEEEEMTARRSGRFNLFLDTDHRRRTNEAILNEALEALRHKPGLPVAH
ncbi:MAG: hypothetical protein A3D99_04770 [Candidatus Andersenbacteria bacterium RIFCSPHIGHO2_12_FULL_45_11]|uniref:Guanylate kinase-like domain-containing protein n=1 Tax=Candidatus Andersenbacteria bacterium RIFCSPHIGHO2_12_FULL_45_11 TaxID=1797281 RepID=A0A1G1X233_9BACT|nr:MAG: hypothetical protein A3D99_04770 [Candidatus Andersenbacteria bacterium RIFCSPHIGHO2_12_FULL_45_11]